MHSLAQGQQTGLEHQVADQMAQQGYGQNMFPYHLIPANLQQDIANALASGNNELAQAATQRFMQYAQVRPLHCHLRHHILSLTSSLLVKMLVAPASAPFAQEALDWPLWHCHKVSATAALCAFCPRSLERSAAWVPWAATASKER